MNEPKTAIIYARVSSARQADEGISMESQIEHGERKAIELGATITHIFRDDGKTGRNHRAGGADRRRQVDDCQPRLPVL